MFNDTKEYVKKFPQRQRFILSSSRASVDLHTLQNSWTLIQWGLGHSRLTSLSTASVKVPAGCDRLFHKVDWSYASLRSLKEAGGQILMAEPHTSLRPHAHYFIWQHNKLRQQSGGCLLCQVQDHLLHRFSLSHTILFDNITNFASRVVAVFCAKYKITHQFSMPYYPQGNSWAEISNHTILDSLYKSIDKAKGKWVEKLPGVCRI